jgi:hypothetical protein
VVSSTFAWLLSTTTSGVPQGFKILLEIIVRNHPKQMSEIAYQASTI